jgi:hypothetical protein
MFCLKTLEEEKKKHFSSMKLLLSLDGYEETEGLMDVRKFYLKV